MTISEYKKVIKDKEVYKYTSQKSADGLFYYHYMNKEAMKLGSTFNEVVNFSPFNGCTLLDNHSGRDGCQVANNYYQV